MSDDLKLSLTKWGEHYERYFPEHTKKNLEKERKEYEVKYLDSVIYVLKSFCHKFKNKVYLEIGCGPFFVGQKLAGLGSFPIGIDFSFGSLKVAEYYLKTRGLKNYLLICGDITKMPLRDNVCDILYGGGVIEHFKDTVTVVKEIHRVLKKDGISVNTVPLLNLGSLTYRQVWGNIPNLTLLKEVAEFIHIRLLKARHMRFGYEFSFTRSKIRKIFINSGFKKNNIKINQFKTTLTFDYVKNIFLKRLAVHLAQTSSFFWPMIYIAAQK